MLIVSNFEVCKTQVVVQLGITVVHNFSLLKRCDRQNVLLLFVHGDTVEEEGVEGARVVLLQMVSTDDCETFPVLVLKHVLAHLMEAHLLFHVELFLAAVIAHLTITLVPIIFITALFINTR